MIQNMIPFAAPARQEAQRRLRPLLQVRLLAGFAVGMGGGTLAGLFARDLAATELLMRWVVRPVEQVFLCVLFVLIVPLLVAAIVSGLARIRNTAGMRRLLLSTLAYMVAVSTSAALIGLAMANLFRPGDVVPTEIGQQLLAARGPVSPQGWLEAALSYSSIERPVVLAAVAFSLFAGVALTLLRPRRAGWVLAASERVFDGGMRVLALVTRFAPVAVACFMFDMTLVFGWHLLVYLSAYVGVVVAALLLQVVLTFFAVVWMRGGLSPLGFLRGVQEAALIAFCTSSSNATLPTALKTAEVDLGLQPRAARLVLGIGTVANQSGTAIYTAVTVLFIAQFFGMDLSLDRQGLVLAVAALAGMGTIGVPAGSLPTVAAVLALNGLPAEGIGLVIGVDRLLDMFRTMVNVVGDLAIAVAVSSDQQGRGVAVV
jgi:DAACS family dicarboxylate/amino acid:cation (Na+ or H+) symporter